MIYCIEDDSNIRELVVYTLETTGYIAQGFEDGTSFFKTLSVALPDLILLDIMLPGEDGLEILHKLKSMNKTKHIPVIMMTAKGSEYDKVVGLDSGADDYVTKPFGMMELISRIKAVLRRTSENKTSKVIEYGALNICMDKHIVKVNNQVVLLTLKEFELLRRLAERPGMVVTRDILLSEVWGYDFDGETRTIDVHIRTLRQKLGDVGNLIITVRGIGYKLGDNNEA